MDLGVLLTLPLESVALRAVLAAAAAIVLVRLLLRRGLRTPGPRVIAALAPTIALVSVVVLSGTSLQLPSLMVPVESAGGLPIPMGDGFVYFAPLAVPLLVGLWLGIAAVRLSRRAVSLRRIRRQAERARRHATTVPEISALATDVARALKVTTPSVLVLPRVPGGAVVVGSRRPVVLLDRDLIASFDPHELEGVLAHELAHVRRHDNQVAMVLGIVRDLAFFVPGGGWAVRQLHRERELAADQVAVAATGRPGALASGLLKVLEAGPDTSHACAAFAPGGSLVDRVRVLVDDAPATSRVRRLSESLLVVGVILIAALLALVLPTALAGAERQREAMALVWAPAPAADAAAAAPATEPGIFELYRRTNLDVAPRAEEAPSRFDESSVENRRSTMRACAQGDGCPGTDAEVGLGLRPRPTVVVDHGLSWEATPVVDRMATDSLQLYWLARVQ